MKRVVSRSAVLGALAASVLFGVPAASRAQPAPAPPPPAAPAGPVRTLSVDDAVALALEQNLSIQVERVNPRIQDENVRLARTAWAPSLSGGLSYNNADNPPDSFLSGAEQTLKTDFLQSSTAVAQQLPWGGSYSVGWNGARSTSNNIFSNFNPRLQSNFSVDYLQPLLRNFSIDAARQQLLVTRKNREISDVQLRATVVTTVRNVKSAYWDLVYAINNLAVQQQSLDLARQTLRDNRTRVEVGTMAPIDIVEAEAEVARNDEAVIVAGAQIKQAEDRLRALVFDPGMPDFWQTAIEPTDAPQVRAATIDPDAAVRNALDKRTDLQQAKKQLEATEINMRYYRNQLLPQLNLEAAISTTGLGGRQFERGEGFPGPVVGVFNRGFGSVLGDVFGNSFPTWTVGLSIAYPIGTSPTEATLARTRLQYSQSELSIRHLQLQVGTEVRDLARQVNTNLKRVEATRASRQLAERRLEAEQKKFGVGMSTSFQVFQAQRDLSSARNNELRAILDYNKSLVDFEAVQEASIGGTSGIAIGGSQAVTVPTTVTTQQQTSAVAQQQRRQQ